MVTVTRVYFNGMQMRVLRKTGLATTQRAHAKRNRRGSKL
jgi:hypothetical protein